jgi:hypothetical protein
LISFASDEITLVAVMNSVFARGDLGRLTNPAIRLHGKYIKPTNKVGKSTKYPTTADGRGDNLKTTQNVRTQRPPY